MVNKLLRPVLPSALLLPVLLAPAQAKTAAPQPISLNFQTSPQTVLDGKVRVQASPQLRYLDAADARKVIVDLWGNPPGTADDVLGLLVPGEVQLGSRASWAIVMTENRDGHVSDSDAGSVDYASLLRDMQTSAQDSSAEREKAGYDAVRVVGWAQPPSYDAAAHKMIWAKDIAFGKESGGSDSLNYAVRVLGRDDVLELNAVGDMSQLAQIRSGMEAVLPLVTFTPGHTYADYQQGNDKLAEYGLAGLVLGGLAVKKLGLVALLPLLLKKGWILLVALFGAGSRLLRRRSSVRGVRSVPAAPAAASGAPVSVPVGVSDAAPLRTALHRESDAQNGLGRQGAADARTSTLKDP